MIGLDTNVLVRYIMQDDQKQSPRANRLIESLTVDEPGYIPLVALVELVWVLSASYKLSRTQVGTALDSLLQSRELVLDRNEQVTGALRIFQTGSADFADCLIERIAKNAGCGEILTFDAGAAKRAGMTLLR